MDIMGRMAVAKQRAGKTSEQDQETDELLPGDTLSDSSGGSKPSSAALDSGETGGRCKSFPFEPDEAEKLAKVSQIIAALRDTVRVQARQVSKYNEALATDREKQELEDRATQFCQVVADQRHCMFNRMFV